MAATRTHRQEKGKINMSSEPQNQMEKKSFVKQIRKPKARRKWMILAAVASVLLIVVIAVLLRKPKGITTIASAETTILKPVDVQKTISATGTVGSAASYKIYSASTNTIDEIYVSVGHQVSAGDKLCQLDKTSLEQQIKSKETALGITAESAALKVQSAKEKYDTSKKALSSGTNTNLINANNAVTNAYNALVKAKKTYEDYAAALKNGENSQLLSQKAAVDNAANSLEIATLNYNKASSTFAAAEQALMTAENGLRQAQVDLDNANIAVETAKVEYAKAEQAYNTAKAVVDTAGQNVTQDQLDAMAAAKTNMDHTATTLADAQTAAAQMQQAYSSAKTAADSAQASASSASDALQTAELAKNNAQTVYDNAKAQYGAASNTSDNTLSDYKLAAESAYQSYLSAKASLTAATVAAQEEVKSNLNNLQSSEVSAKNDVAVEELAGLYQDLKDTTITAPSSGTITAVYAEVGSKPTGILFIIESLDTLTVDASVKEYDIDSVKEGMEVNIKSDTTGDAVYAGKITSIAPTSDKNQTGETITGSDINFTTKIDVLSKDTGLHIGMNVRLEYIIDQEKAVFAVPLDAVYTNALGGKYILAAVSRPDGKVVLTEYPVSTSLENDFDVVISGKDIVEGLRVLNTPAGYKAGAVFTITGK